MIMIFVSSFGQTEVVKTSIPSSQVSNLNIPVAGGKYQAKVHHKTKKHSKLKHFTRSVYIFLPTSLSQSATLLSSMFTEDPTLSR